MFSARRGNFCTGKAYESLNFHGIDLWFYVHLLLSLHVCCLVCQENEILKSVCLLFIQVHNCMHISTFPQVVLQL